MKKHLIAAAVAAAVAVPAMAQVTLSGSVQTELAKTGVDGTEVGMVSGSGGINNLTFTATEDLGQGNKARVVLNQRFSAATGISVNTDDSSGSSYQNSFVELSGGFGAVSLGRHSNDSMSFTDPWGGSGQSASVAISNTGTRVDSFALYSSPSLNGFQAKLGTGSTATANSDEFTSLVLSYTAGPLVARVGREETAAKVETLYYGGTYDLKMVKLGASHQTTKTDAGVETSKQTLYSFEAPLGGNLSARGGMLDGVSNADKWAVGLKNALSKRTHVYADAFKSRTNTSNGYAVGVVHAF